MKYLISVPLVLLFLISGSIAVTAEIPTELHDLILENYPVHLLCEEEANRQQGDLIPPLEEHFKNGWINLRFFRIADEGPDFAGVLYSYDDHFSDDDPLIDWRARGNLLIFEQRDGHWIRLDPVGHPGAIMLTDDWFDLIDVDGDGVKEIFTGDLWKVVPEGLWPMISSVFSEFKAGDLANDFPLGMPEWCNTVYPVDLGPDPDSPWLGTTGAGFKDLDGDGVMELVALPEQERLPDPDPTCPPDTCAPYWQDVTGTWILKLVDGVYQLVGETPVGVGLRSQMAAAMAPASIPQEMMLAHLDRSTADTKEREPGIPELATASKLSPVKAQKTASDRSTAQVAKITLYVGPPQGYSLDQVDWSTLKVAGGALAPDEDEGTHIAPNTAEFPEAWVRWPQSGQVMYLEDLKESDPGNFSCGDEDPIVFLAPGGRLHFSSAYRILRFDASEVLTWLATQWKAGRMDSEGKSCFSMNDRDICYTPIGLPFEVRLTTGIGPFSITAHGVAMLWVRN